MIVVVGAHQRNEDAIDSSMGKAGALVEAVRRVLGTPLAKRFLDGVCAVAFHDV